MSTDNSSVKEKRLLLLDLNGTMIYRTEYPLRNAKPSLFVRSKYTYVRIGSPKFVQKMSQYFTVGVYSSVMSHNIEASLNAILPNWKRFISVVYDRNYNKKDPDPVKEWDTVRDMTKIWKPSSQFNSKNTILVDNESRKVQDCPENAIIVSQYEAADVENQVAGSLDGLEIYLERMAKSEEFQRDEFDVKKYLALNRFQSFSETRGGCCHIKIGSFGDSEKESICGRFFSNQYDSKRYPWFKVYLHWRERFASGGCFC